MHRNKVCLAASFTFLFLFLVPHTGSADVPRMLDELDMASPDSRSLHHVEFTRADTCAEEFPIGALVLPVSGVRMDPGGMTRLTMTTKDGRKEPCSLVFTLGTAPRDYGKLQAFRVSIDGREVYAAIESDAGGGLTRSIVVELSGRRAVVRAQITADSASSAPITICSVRWYAGDAPRGAFASSRNQRMGLALLTSKGYGYSLDASTMREIYHLQRRSPYLQPQVAVLFNFCERDRAENTKEIDRLADMAAGTGIPLRIAFQFHWGGIPRHVPDSGGVTFSDLPYQMITYDPDDQTDDPGLAALLGDRYDIRFGLSVPNVWSDTPWLTFNSPRLNRFRQTRLGYALAAWHAARERLRPSGRDTLLPPEISTGEETVYWAKGVNDSKYTTANGGKPRTNLMADFNPCVVSDALHDGVTLDPRDGLDQNERFWLHQNLAHWQQKIVTWMMEDSPPCPIRLKRGVPEFATDLVRRNVFTEPYAMPLYPMLDVTPYHPGLEVGYVLDGRSGGEYWSGATILPWLQMERERGRIALPNIECTVTDDAQLTACLRAAYAFGARFLTIYNWHVGTKTAAVLKAFADSIETAPRIQWLAGRANEDRSPSPATGEPGSGRAAVEVRQYTAPPVAFGVNRIELFPLPGGSLPDLVSVTLHELDTAHGESATVSMYPSRTQHRRQTSMIFDLPGFFHQKPHHRYALIVEIVNGASFRFARARDGMIAARLTSDLILERARSVMIEERQDVADLLASLRNRQRQPDQTSYAGNALKEAEKLFESGRSSEAYRTGIRAEQLFLPATFLLTPPGGSLTPYPISVRCPNGEVQAVVEALSDRSATVSVHSDFAQTVTVRFGRISKRVRLSANESIECSLGSAD